MPFKAKIILQPIKRKIHYIAQLIKTVANYAFSGHNAKSI